MWLFHLLSVFSCCTQRRRLNQGCQSCYPGRLHWTTSLASCKGYREFPRQTWTLSPSASASQAPEGNRTVPLGLPPSLALCRLSCAITLRALPERGTRLPRQESARWRSSREPTQLVIFCRAGKGKMHTWPSRDARLEEEDAVKYTNNMVIVHVDTYRVLITHWATLSDSHVLTYFCQFIRYGYCLHLTGQGDEAWRSSIMCSKSHS